MRADAIPLEDGRLSGLDHDNYPWFHERHRIFPTVLLDKPHAKVLDIAAGIGIVGKRIQDQTDAEMICNDISSKALEALRSLGLRTASFDLDDPKRPFPYEDETFDAVISLATFEHIIHLDFHIKEIRRILRSDGHLFISTPNYSGLQFYVPFLLRGESFHDPLGSELDRYEFYAHVRYFTYATLLRFIRSFGFVPREVYLPLPDASTRYAELRRRSPFRAVLFRSTMWAFYKIANPRWAFHPVLCFRKARPDEEIIVRTPRKIVM